LITQLLVKEQELAEKAVALKEASSKIEGFKLEITRLRHYEEELANLQVVQKTVSFYHWCVIFLSL
jgi:hypothetical protein